MGLLDLPAFLWSWTDIQMAAMMPPTARIVAWGIVAAIVSLGLYWLLSPQSRMVRISQEERRIKTTLRDDTLEMAEGLAAARALLRLALTRLGLVLLPVLLAALPLLSLMSWLEANYAYNLPPLGQTAEVRVEPHVANGRWIATESAPPRVEVVDDRGSLMQSVQVQVPIPVIEKRSWWNALIGNPLGYLPDDSPIDRIDIALPASQYLTVGPVWARGWVAPFIATMLVGSMFLKFMFRIQ
ncbi:MAG: hypothetical protein ACREDO_09840 [Methyloceanibacter sp.]